MKSKKISLNYLIFNLGVPVTKTGKTDPFEVNNRINSPDSKPVVKKLMQYYADFEKKVSDEGKKQMTANALKGSKEARK